MKPWYKVVTPREDLREGKPLDASEFAVHLDHVRDGKAPTVYQNPAEFFERTYLTNNLHDLVSEVVRRLSGNKVQTSAVFNLATQFGGGKTHALTLLYHLARGGERARTWKGVDGILGEAAVANIPEAATAIFVGTEFDSIKGRGGNDGTPRRLTPWGEIAFQLGGAPALEIVAQHETEQVAPGGDVIAQILPTEKPTLILLDELMNYVSRFRKSGLGGQLYHFLHNLSEAARKRDNVVLAVSVPASELEMTAEDQSDYERIKHLLNRLGKSVVMSAETETSEIIRRRLFEWGGLPDEARDTINEYVAWLKTNKTQIPSWFPIDGAHEILRATYPFHPSTLTVFERKWRALPRFQQTRGMLRLLALWVSRAYSEDYRRAYKDPLLSLGSAPLEDALFRSAVFEQLGETRLEAAVTTDIAGHRHSHAARLDDEAAVEVKKARLHRKVATAVFFESNGGQHRGEASLPEVRLAIAEPGIDIGSIEQCLETLAETGYYLTAERNRYRFSFQPNLNKLLADRRASVGQQDIQECVLQAIRKVFEMPKSLSGRAALEVRFFPQKSTEIPDRPQLALWVLSPEQAVSDPTTRSLLTTLITESGNSSRTFKSALLFCVADGGSALNEDARKLLAWEDILGDAASLKLDDVQRQRVMENVKKAEASLRETVWRSYKNVCLLAEDNSLRQIDFGLVHSSSAGSMVEFILGVLETADITAKSVAQNFLVRYWPPALPEWSTSAVRDMFYASPKFPRLLRPETVKETISRALEGGFIAYVGKTADGGFEPFVYKRALSPSEVEISEDIFIVQKDRAEDYLRAKSAATIGSTGAPSPTPVNLTAKPAAGAQTPSTSEPDLVGGATGDLFGGGTTADSVEELSGFTWTGDIPPQKWSNFYLKVLSRFATTDGLKLSLTAEVKPGDGISQQKLEETRLALRELGLDSTLSLHRKGRTKP